MFEPDSRYAGLETATLLEPQPDGEPRRIRYKRRRFIEAPERMTTLVRHTVIQGERLDLIAARYLGDPQFAWRVCDANGAMRPPELTSEPGRAIEVALPELGA